MIASVIVDVKAKQVNRSFDYWRSGTEIGRVLIA